MFQLIAYKRGSTAPEGVEDGGYFPHVRDEIEYLVGFGTGHISITTTDLLSIVLSQPDVLDLKTRITHFLEWLTLHGLDHPREIDLSRPSTYGVESHVRNFGPDSWGVHGASASPVSVQSRIQAER
tara:strand:+ start:575 stop:952 length:378 start_codon:yes stop_codon:yes gene_type:complete